MTESGIAELRRLLRTRDDSAMRDEFISPAGTSFGTFIACCEWKLPTKAQVLADLTPAELRMFLTFVLYAETDK
jgi:hypothetical protein